MNDSSTILRSHRYRLTTYVLSGVILLGLLFSIAAQASTIVEVVPAMLSIRYGEKAQLSVEILNATNVYGFELHISYDPTKVQVVDGDPRVAGIQWLPGDLYEVGQGFLVASEADNEAGKALYAFTLLAPAAPMEGSGTLAILELEAIGGGSSAIQLEEVILASPDGEALPFVANDGEVVVEGAPEVTSTAPAVPTESSTSETEIIASPTPTLPINGDSSTNKFSQYALLGLIFVLILFMIGVLFLILRWGFRRR
jgi:hypothetical protein